ncbi:MAG TPA: RHS repeat-associated core domain-containing protein [Candidatus Limnocylindrales bacterium]|nr:RHS repeat-associated core domain-containing protein [Candidatus Limnocylindrales bacterium]
MSAWRLRRRYAVLGACAALLVAGGEAGNYTATTYPAPQRVSPHSATPAPAQRWGAEPEQAQPQGKSATSAAPAGNRTIPASLRQQFPLRPEPPVPEPQPNEATNAVDADAPAITTLNGFDARTSTELPEARGAYTRTYANADGTQTTALSGSRLNFRDRDGAWKQVDPRLVPVAGAGWRNAADSVDVRFGAYADDPALVRVGLDGGRGVSFGLAGAARVAGTANGGTVAFHGVRPDTDIEFEMGADRVKETLVLRSPAAPATFAFPLTLIGLTAQAADDGSIILVDPRGEPYAGIPAGFMVDAAGAVSTGVTYRLSIQNGRRVLGVDLDVAWLRDPARVFPVRADPSVAWGATDSTMVVQGGSSRLGGTELVVGRLGGSAAATYLKFNGLVDQLRFHTIYGTQLSIVEYDSPSCGPRSMSVHAVTQSWTAGTGYSYPGPAVGGALAAKSFAYGYIALGQSRSACPADRVLFDLGRAGRDVVQGWVNGGANNGLSLRASATDTLAWKRITGSGTANPPTLYVTHSPYNAEYAIPNPVPNPPVLQNQAGTVKVTVTNRGAEAWSPSNYYLAYRAYDSATHRLVTQQRSANLPATLARGARVTLTATIAPLPPGKYYIDFTMVRTGGIVFTDQQVPPARIVLKVIDIPPVLQELYPPNGYQTPTLTPQLWARAVDIDAPPGTQLRFVFETCELNSAGVRINCLATGDLLTQAWTVPGGRLFWSKSYQWRATVKDGSNIVTSDWVNLITAVPQPEVTGQVAGAPYSAGDREFDPQVGNYTTSAVDASAGTASPSLTLTRTYNSLDPRRDLAFGAGWVTTFDMRVTPDDDGSGNVVVTYPDGQQVRFGRNPDGTFAPPQGRTAVLVVAGTSYTLSDRAGVSYQFGGTGRLAKITDAGQRSVVLSYDTTGKLARAQVSNSQTNTAGRSLLFTWTGAHVTTVTNDAGSKWAYTYSGDLLTGVCGPTGDCTSYTYAPGAHYRTAVLDSGPQSYWRLGEAEGAGAASEVAVNLGKDAGIHRSVTLAAAGIAGGGGNTAATFDGTSSLVELPKGALKKSRDAAVELWFKISAVQTGGPLVGYQDTAFSGAPAAGVPLLYVGTDGRLRGQFRTGAITPITSGTTVNNGLWHHAVLSAMGSTQTLWLDGVKVGTLNAAVDHNTLTFNQIGAAYATSAASWPGWGATARRYFSGAIDEVAVYHHPLGQAAVTSHFRYGSSAADQLTKVTLPSGRVAAEISYDTARDRVKEYTDSNGGTWKLGLPTVYGGDADLRRSVSVLDPGGRPYFYEYDALASRLLRSGAPTGLGTREEDLPGYPLPTGQPPPPTPVCTTPDPNDPSFCTVLPGDNGGVPVFVRQPLDGMAVRSFSYNANGFQTAVTNENGATVTMAYDSRGNVTAQTTCRTATLCHTEYRTYPATVTNPLDPRNDLVLEVRDGRSTGPTDNNYRTTYTYTATGELLTQTNPDGGIVRHTYTTGSEPAVGGGATPPAMLATTTDPRGAVTRYAYYANGDLARLTEPSGLVTTFGYDVLGRKTSETEVSDSFPGGLMTSYTYDTLSRLLSTLEPATTDAVTVVRHQKATDQTYDPDGNLSTVTVRDVLGGDPALITKYSYDGYGRVADVTDTEGNVTSYDYDAFGNRTGMVDANGNTFRYAYTARNSLSEVRLRDWRGDPAGAPPVGDYLVVDSYAYDLAGRMVRHTDAMGRRVEYGYFADDLLATVTLKGFHNPDGTTRDYMLESRTYDGAGHTTREVSSNGSLITDHTITRAGQIASTTINPGGLNRRTTFTYDLTGNVTSTSQSGGASNVAWAVPVTSSTVAYEYDLDGNVVKETVGGLVTTYRYDQRGLRVASTDPRGNLTGADPAAFTTTYRYDELGQRITLTSPPVTVETGGGTPQITQPTVQTGYDTFGNPVNTRNELGNTGRLGFDRMGRVVSATGPAYTPPGSATTLTPQGFQRFDGLGNVVENTDARGNTSRYTYDQLNRLVTRDEPASTNNDRAVWRYTYTRTGEVLSVTDPTGARMESTYDDLDRPVTMTAVERRPVANNFTTRYSYDDAGNLRSRSSPGGATTQLSYDALGALTRSTDPAGVVVQYGYDFAGRQVRLTDGLGRTDRTDYDSNGRVASRSDLSAAGATLRTVTYGYDAAGNVATATDGLGITVSYTHDAQDQLIRQVEPVSATRSITTTFGYDASGNRTRYTDGRGNATIYTYNKLELPESVIVPATAAHPNLTDRTWTAGYDAAGLAVRLSAPGNVLRQRTYDAAGRLTAETGSGAESATTGRTLGYDMAGRLLSVSAPGGSNTYTYNDRGAPLTAAGPQGAASFAYNSDGDLLSRTDRAGTSTFTYDRGRLATQTDGITGVTERLGYDAAGQLSTVDYGSSRIRSYGFDDFGRLNSDTLRNAAAGTVSSILYTFDAEDRMVRKVTTGTAGAADNTYGYDLAGRLVSWAVGTTTTAYAWDDSGNRLRDGARTATYDARNRLLADSNSSYVYTARGTLASRTTSGLTDRYSFDAFDRLVSSEGQAYAYDGLDRLATRGTTAFTYAGRDDEVVSDGVQNYARGPEGELLAMAEGPAKRLVLSDEHDDVVAGFDPANTALPTLDGSRGYDPFGKVVAETGGTASNLGFQGDYTDPATDLVQMGARWYDPGSGAFLSRDPTTYETGESILANPYTYAEGDPLDHTDPDGFWPKCGWCKKIKDTATGAVKWGGRQLSRGYRAARSGVSWGWSRLKSGASWGWGALRGAFRWGWSAIKWGASKLSSGFRWAYNKARGAIGWLGSTLSAGYRWVRDRAVSAWHWTRDMVSRGYNAVRGAISRGASWVRDRAEEARRAAIAAARRVTETAKAAVRYAVEHNPLPAIAAALKPVYSTMKKVVSAAAHLPAAVVSTVRDVVRDATKAVQVIYQKAVAAAGTVIDNISSAAQAVSEFAQASMPIVAGVAVGALTTAGCLFVTGGGGSAACIVAGSIAGAAVTSALKCPPGRSIAGCTARGAAAGAVGGLVFVGTGGAGAGLAGTVMSSGLSGMAGNATQQQLDNGRIDIGNVLIAGATSALAKGAQRGIADRVTTSRINAGAPRHFKVDSKGTAVQMDPKTFLDHLRDKSIEASVKSVMAAATDPFTDDD